MDTIIQFLVDWGYIGLFISALVAGSAIPFSSELVMVILMQLGLSPVWCVVVATLGNTTGGMTGFYIGRLGRIEWIEKYFKVKKEKLDKMQVFLQGKGSLMAFFAFLPIVGSIICIALGLMRSNAWLTMISMFTGKLLRYIVLVVTVKYGINWLMEIYPDIRPILNSIRLI